MAIKPIGKKPKKIKPFKPKSLNPTTTQNEAHRKEMEERKIFTGNFGGRPAKYDTKEELIIVIQEYFNEFYCDDNIIKLNDKEGNEKGWDYKRVPSVTGLALHLGFKSRQSLLDYNEKAEFSDTIKQARLFVENFLEERLLQGKGYGPGIMFALKNNNGWVDKQEIDQKTEHSGEIKIIKPKL